MRDHFDSCYCFACECVHSPLVDVTECLANIRAKQAEVYTHEELDLIYDEKRPKTFEEV